MIKILAAAGAACAIALGAAACGSSTTPTSSAAPAAAPAATSSSPVTPAASPSPSGPSGCSAAFATWWDSNGGKGDFDAVQNDLTTAGTDGTAGNDAGMTAAMSQLASDSSTLQTNLPPSCIHGVAADLSRSLSDFEEGAAAFTAGDTTEATTYIQNGDTWLDRALAKLTTWEHKAGL
jgi:hypothetical protein